MKINIITTEKKLTKSIINQMSLSNDLDVQYGTPLGYILNIRKNIYKAVLISYDNNYSIISMDYIKSTKSVYQKIGKWTQHKRFDSEDICDY